MLLASRHSIIAEEQGAQQECSSTLSSLFGVSIFNIYPQAEYDIRKAEAIRYVKALGLDFIDGDYDYQLWRSSMSGMENEPERGSRCLQCFTLRLTETARYAAEHGFRLFTTTLASSRWKSLDQINLAGRRAAALYPGTIFWG